LTSSESKKYLIQFGLIRRPVVSPHYQKSHIIEMQGSQFCTIMCCYKLRDDLVYSVFPSDEFFRYFNLDSQYVLSDEIKEYSNSMSFQAKINFQFIQLYFFLLITLQ
jgi:hypothetical protein